MPFLLGGPDICEKIENSFQVQWQLMQRVQMFKDNGEFRDISL